MTSSAAGRSSATLFMPISTGTRFGPYEIIGAAGSGGMGEVYRARDTRLQRDVAIKVLPQHLASRPELRQRFEREARAISSLSHPNLCALYDVGRDGDTDYLVLEYLEGETLGQRLRRGPLPIEQVLRIGMEIADALDSAHRKGVLHRDLKPGNIMLTRSGTKLLDFGLAKPAAVPDYELTVPSAGDPLTAEGTVLGTYQYMSPEQVEGREADARSDIFALGAVLYEMATGRQAFEGKSAASVLAAVLAGEPPAVSSVQPTSPPALDRVIRTCLAKDPDERFQNAHDLKLQLKWILEGATSSAIAAQAPVAGKRWRRLSRWAPLVLGLVILAAGLVLWYTAPAGNGAVIHASITPPEKSHFVFYGDGAGPAVISPDGRYLAFTASDDQGNVRLWVRPLSEDAPRLLSDTDNATFPFWSSDSKNLGFFAGGKLKRVAVNGGPALTLADAPQGRGGAWSGNTILFAPDIQMPIHAVSANGGVPKAVTKIEEPMHTTHRWPYFLRDGKHFLYLAANHHSPTSEHNAVYVGDTDGRTPRFLMASNSSVAVADGWLLSLREGTLFAQKFNEGDAQLKGEPVPVTQNVAYEPGTWRGVFDVSRTGTLVYERGGNQAGSELLWYGLDGKVLGRLGSAARYQNLRLSPDRRKAAVVVGDPDGSVYLLDLARGVPTRLSFSGIVNNTPVWSPDGARLVFGVLSGASKYTVILKNVSGWEEQALLHSDQRLSATSWSPDGKYLIFDQGGLGRRDIMLLPLTGERKLQPFLTGPRDEYGARFSPDGRWLVYASDESGRPEVYVTSFPGPRGKWQISGNGGDMPLWRPDGKAVLFWSGSTLIQAELQMEDSNLEVLGSRQLFRVPSLSLNDSNYDVSADGKRFLVNSAEPGELRPISLVTNWAADLKR